MSVFLTGCVFPPKLPFVPIHPSNGICCLPLQSQLHNLTASFTWTNCEKYSLAAIRTVSRGFFCLFPFLFFCFFFTPLCCACQCQMIVMRLASVHATGSLGKAGVGRKQITISSVCVCCWGPGADFWAATTSARLELSELLRSCLCHHCN